MWIFFPQTSTVQIHLTGLRISFPGYLRLGPLKKKVKDVQSSASWKEEKKKKFDMKAWKTYIEQNKHVTV